MKVRDKFWLFASRAHDDDIWLGKSHANRFTRWSRITPAEGAAMLDVPNVIMIGSDGVPAPYSAEAYGYMESFCRMQNVVWSIAGSGGFRAGNEEQFICELAKRYPNVTGAFADDFMSMPDATVEEIDAAFQPNTKALFGETIANPALTVLDIEKFADAAHRHGVPLIIDNTFPTPVNCRPIEWGADIVTHSTTKYMDGHGVAVGGAIIDAGRFDWMAHADKYPGLCTPDESYHGVTYAEKFGKEGAFITKCTSQLMRDLGCIQSPQHAFYLNLGLESLHVRMPKHCENGLAVATFLKEQPAVKAVNYPHLPGDKYYDLAMKYMPNGGCGVVSFELKGGRAAAEAFMKQLKLAAIETHVADARTCCLNPATSTHRQMSEEQLAAAGVPAGLVRISCGLEGAADLIADIAQALEAVQ